MMYAVEALSPNVPLDEQFGSRTKNTGYIWFGPRTETWFSSSNGVQNRPNRKEKERKITHQA